MCGGGGVWEETMFHTKPATPQRVSHSETETRAGDEAGRQTARDKH